MTGKITYGREEGGFAVYVDGRKQGIWRMKGWMNNLLKTPEYRPSCVKRSSKFDQTQANYQGQWE